MHRSGTPRAIHRAMERSTNIRERRFTIRTLTQWRSLLLLVASILGCGGLGSSGPSQPPPPSIRVAVAPAATSVPLGAAQTFTATVTSTSGSVSNTAVSWSVNGVSGGNATVGTIDTGGVYTAPAIVPAAGSVSVQATSMEDSSRSSTAIVTITSAFSLVITGPSSVNAGSSATYTATLTPAANSNPSRTISWSVSGTGCTGSACGTISSSSSNASGGVYTAPSLAPSPAIVNIVATPQADPSKAVSISVSIVPVFGVSVSPTAATVALGGTVALQATVTGAHDSTVTWSVNGAVGGNATAGTILNSQTSPNSTTYTAPQTLPEGGSVTVSASSNANPSVSASATITFTAAIGVTVSPSSATLAVNHRQTFTALVNNTSNQNVTWQINGISGGNSSTGEICVTGSSPCQSISASNGGSVDYLAPAGVPSSNPVEITATSQVSSTRSASASVTILPHVIVGVLPGSAGIPSGGQQRFSATVTGTTNQQVTWSITGTACTTAGACGVIDSTGLYTAPPAAPSPDTIGIVATSADDTSQSGAATVTITSGLSIFSLAPTSAYAGSAGGFTLLVSGSNFITSSPGPGSTILVAGTSRVTNCTSNTQCTTSLASTDLQSAGNISVQIQNPNGSLSNTQTFVVLATGSGTATIPLTPSAPTSAGNNIVVVELSTNGGSGAAGNVSLNIAAIGPYTVATGSCVLGGNPVIVQRPATGAGTADLCVFSVSGLDPSFIYAISGPPTPDIAVVNRAPLGLGILHLTLQVPSTAEPGPRTLFVTNPESDMAAGTGAIEVR